MSKVLPKWQKFALSGDPETNMANGKYRKN
jgi:hypothetical protein